MSQAEDEETREENLKDEEENKDKEDESEKGSKKKLHDEGNTSNARWCSFYMKQSLKEIKP